MSSSISHVLSFRNGTLFIFLQNHGSRSPLTRLQRLNFRDFADTEKIWYLRAPAHHASTSISAAWALHPHPLREGTTRKLKRCVSHLSHESPPMSKCLRTLPPLSPLPLHFFSPSAYSPNTHLSMPRPPPPSSRGCDTPTKKETEETLPQSTHSFCTHSDIRTGIQEKNHRTANIDGAWSQYLRTHPYEVTFFILHPYQGCLYAPCSMPCPAQLNTSEPGPCDLSLGLPSFSFAQFHMLLPIGTSLLHIEQKRVCRMDDTH